MRTDVKVGLICVFAIILAVVIYFVAQSNSRGRATQAANPPAGQATPPASPAPAAAPSTPSMAVSPAATTAPSMAAGSDLPNFSMDAPMSTPPAAAAATPAIVPDPIQLAQANTGEGSYRGPMIPPPSSPSSPVAPGSGGPRMSAPPPSPTTPAPGAPSFSSPPSSPSGTPGLGGGNSMIPANPGPATRPGFDAVTLESAPSPRNPTAPRDAARPLPNPGGANFGNRPGTAGRPPAGTPSFGTTPSTPTGLGSNSAVAPGSTGTHTIQKGDMLGTIAKKYGVTVKAIEAANPGLDANRLRVNSTIKIPASAVAGISTTRTPAPVGSTTGTSNGTALAGGIPVPTITLGSTPAAPTTRPANGAASRSLRTPTAGASRIAARPGSTYTIKRGDSLVTIAQAAYGTKDAWRRIYRANRGELNDANTIPVGTTIRLPE